MPLPDERPQRSVANLIGRFETQNKRLSISAGSPSRSSSVVSHITGDSAREETKDKREWPPKSVISTPILTSIRPVALSLKSDPSPSTASTSVKVEPPSQAKCEVPLTTKALQAQTAEAPTSFLENWRKDIPSIPAEMASESVPTSSELTVQVSAPSLPTPTAASMQNPSRTPTAVLKTPTKSSLATSKVTPAVSKAPIKGMSKSPAPKQTLSSSTTQSLRPQHTGQSIVSTTSTRKPTTKPAPTPNTPSQSKTGPRSDASHAKTPTSTRSKTPSSGLFAPTAASLARSRNAPPQLTPTKKPTLSSNSTDRLSKPTAASLSRARPPAVAASTPTSRSTVTKTRLATTAHKPKESIAQEPAVQTVATTNQNGSSTVSDVREDSIIEAETPLVADTTEGTVSVNESAHSEDADASLVSSSVASNEENIAEEPLENSAPGVSTSQQTTNHLEEHKSTDELEDIVNLLVSVSPAKSEPATIPDIPDDILEIPDEHQ